MIKNKLSILFIFLLPLIFPAIIHAAADTTISVSNPASTITDGDTFTLNINLDSGDNELIGVELYLDFDHTKLKVNSITNSSFFTNPETIAPQINNTNGTVYYVIYLPPNSTPQSGQGRLATISFTALSAGTTTVSVNNNTIVAAINESGQNALSSVSASSFTISQASSTSNSAPASSTPTPTPSPSINPSFVSELPDTGNSLPTIFLSFLALLLIAAPLSIYFIRR